MLLHGGWEPPRRVDIAEVKLAAPLQRVVHTLDDLGLSRAQVDDAVAGGDVDAFVLDPRLCAVTVPPTPAS